MSRRLIVSADDFGLAPEVNDAVERGHRDGILRAASLMVNARATGDAIERARRLPGLAIGLHVVLVHGCPVLPPERIPDLVDEGGAFLTDLPAAGVRFARPGARAQLAAEIRAQFERFAATGLRLDHVDAQSHMHVHPTVFALLLAIGREYGMRAIRIPREPLNAAFGARRDRLGARLGYAAITSPWLALMRARAHRAGLVCNDAAFGVNDAGVMTEARVLGIVERLPHGLTEMFFHPATTAFDGADEGTNGYRWAEELAALTSPRVRAALERGGIARVTYGEVVRDAA